MLSRRDIPLREKALWRMLYETAARASEILALNVEDLDLEQRRPPVRSKGGDTKFVYWDTGTAHLLPRLLRLPDGTTRTSGPVFLASRRPVPARRPAPRDICPHTGRARLGYDRARVLFKKHTATATSGGLELHQLRHSAATHLGDQKVPLQLIMAKTRHRSPRTVMRYVKPGDAAVAEVTSLLGPPRRTPTEPAATLRLAGAPRVAGRNNLRRQPMLPQNWSHLTAPARAVCTGLRTSVQATCRFGLPGTLLVRMPVHKDRRDLLERMSSWDACQRGQHVKPRLKRRIPPGCGQEVGWRGRFP
ncbi:MAG TPA: site-specific integrase [Trebonia sp.]|jgi:hypothetical protein|nr:site-specific integrase [Trebonia sp.]